MRKILATVVCAPALLAACSSASNSNDVDPARRSTAPLLGAAASPVRFTDGSYRDSNGSNERISNARMCNATEQGIIVRGALMARAIVASEAFEECMQHAVRRPIVLESPVGWVGPYLPCVNPAVRAGKSDAWQGYDAAPRAADGSAIPDGATRMLLDFVRDMNGLNVSCDDTLRNGIVAHAPLLASNFFYEDEAIAFSAHAVAGVGAAELLPPCTTPGAGGGPGCRAPGNASAHIASSLLHEMLHSHRFMHGAPPSGPDDLEDDATAAAGCGYAPNAYSYATNSANYIAERCALAVGIESDLHCGSTQCGSRAALVTGIGDTMCECVSDATSSGFRPSQAFLHAATAASMTPDGTGTRLPQSELSTTFAHDPTVTVSFTHVWNADGATLGVYVGAPTRARYDATNGWVIETIDRSPMPAGATFAVRVARGGVVTTGADGSLGHPLLDGPGLVTATPTGTARTGLFAYSPSAHAMIDANGARIGGQSFALSVSSSPNRGLHYEHFTGGDFDSPGQNSTWLSHPRLNAHPNALLLVTQVADTRALPTPVGVWYSSAFHMWAVYREDRLPMPAGLRFDIEVLADEQEQWLSVNESGPYGATASPPGAARATTPVNIYVPADSLLSTHATGSILASQTTCSAFVYPYGPPPPPNLPFWCVLPTTLPLAWAPPFSLVGYGSAGNTFALGADSTWPIAADVGWLSLDTNDPTRGDGTGFYNVEVRLFSRPTRFVFR